MNPKSNSKLESRPPLRKGSDLVVHPDRQANEKSVAVSIERIEDGTIWLKGSTSRFDDGDLILLEYRVSEKGRFLTDVAVEVNLPDGVSIDCSGEWRWVQDRDFVRISTHGIGVSLPTPKKPRRKKRRKKNHAVDDEPSSEGESLRFEMLDMSAGGFRFETRAEFEIDSEFVCHFELPGQSCYVLPARVVRIQRNPHNRNLYWVGVVFLGIDEDHRSELVRWINQEQVRRHRSPGS